MLIIRRKVVCPTSSNLRDRAMLNGRVPAVVFQHSCQRCGLSKINQWVCHCGTNGWRAAPDGWIVDPGRMSNSD
jgi:hypothetical protein